MWQVICKWRANSDIVTSSHLPATQLLWHSDASGQRWGLTKSPAGWHIYIYDMLCSMDCFCWEFLFPIAEMGRNRLNRCSFGKTNPSIRWRSEQPLNPVESHRFFFFLMSRDSLSYAELEEGLKGLDYSDNHHLYIYTCICIYIYIYVCILYSPRKMTCLGFMIVNIAK